MWQRTYVNMEKCFEDELRCVLFEFSDFQWIDDDTVADLWNDKSAGMKWLNNLNAHICSKAPFPKCNGAEGCEKCEYQY